MSILGPSTGWSALAFGDSNDSTNGLLAYSHLSKYLQIGTGEADAYVRFMAGNSVEALRLESGLRVSASAGFHANGAATFGSSVSATGSISGSSTLQIVGAGSFGSSVSATGSISGSSTLQAVGATTLGSTLNVSGNTGIGTDATGGILLHVSASTGALFQIDATSGSVPSANAPILYVTGGAVGKVGIGTQTPTAQLAVNGALHVTGSILPGADNSHDLGSSAMRWANVYTGDLHLANDRGDWTVIEEENYLTIRSNKTGKRFKLLMEEIEDYWLLFLVVLKVHYCKLMQHRAPFLQQMLQYYM
jgi:hypothetical protein